MRPSCNENGFTLFEILVAIVVLTIGVVGITTLILTLIRSNTNSNRITTATTLAQDKLEDVKRLGFAAAGTGTENYDSIANYTSYKRVTTVANNMPVANTRTVTVTVFWESDKHKVTLNTILAQ